MFNTSLNNGSNEKVGTIKAFGGSVAPFGWLICDGSAISRMLYAELFAIIGTTYGAGDGSTTFNIPNLIGLTSDNVPCCGNGNTLIILGRIKNTGQLAEGGIGFNSESGTIFDASTINTPAGSVQTYGNYAPLQGERTVGITTNPINSGIISSLSSASQKSWAIIKY